MAVYQNTDMQGLQVDKGSALATAHLPITCWVSMITGNIKLVHSLKRKEQILVAIHI